MSINKTEYKDRKGEPQHKKVLTSSSLPKNPYRYYGEKKEKRVNENEKKKYKKTFILLTWKPSHHRKRWKISEREREKTTEIWEINHIKTLTSFIPQKTHKQNQGPSHISPHLTRFWLPIPFINHHELVHGILNNIKNHESYNQREIKRKNRKTKQQ